MVEAITMDATGRFRDAFIIYEISYEIGKKPISRIFYYYVGQFIRINYSLKYGISSERFGKLITNFSIKKNERINKQRLFQDCIFNMLDEINQIEEIKPSFLDRNGIPILKGSGFSMKWIGSEDLEQISIKLGKLQTNKIRSYAAAFSKEKKDPIDWRKPFPKPHFKQFTFIDKAVESGYGFWIPKINHDILEDVGFVYLQDERRIDFK